MVTVSPTSLRLAPNFLAAPYSRTPTSLNLSISSVDSVLPLARSRTRRLGWCATWNMVADTPLFGWTLKWFTSMVVVQHWNQVLPTSSGVSGLSPQSARIALIPCQGCSLRDPSAYLKAGSLPDSSLQSYPCLFRMRHDQCSDLQHLHLSTHAPSAVNYLNINSSRLFPVLRRSYGLITSEPIFASSTSDNSVFLPPSRLGLFFADPTTSAPSQVALDSRTFCRALFTAQSFNELINLPSLRPVNDLYTLIHWDFTFAALKFSLDSVRGHMSFEDSSFIVFRLKLLSNNLPLLPVLQRRRPDLYDLDMNCLLCGFEQETWNHLWRCLSSRPALHMLLIVFRRYLERSILSSSFAHLWTPSAISEWELLPCWSFPVMFPTDSVSRIDFSVLLRGFVPLDLAVFLSRFFGRASLRDLLSSALCHAQFQFRENVWLPRWEEICQAEIRYLQLRELNRQCVSSHVSSPVSRRPRSVPGSSSSPFSLSGLSLWPGWVRYFVGNTRQLMEGFPLHVNISFR
jgi:hypothetical protein